MASKVYSRDELGDFQTPLPLVVQILDYLRTLGKPWQRVLEPTCGCGNFIQGVLREAHPPGEIQAIEIQQTYVDQARSAIASSAQSNVNIIQANLFELDLRRDLHWNTHGPLLIIGNPPWITNSELGASSSNNLPTKRNIKGLSGLEAITGSANFDLAEAIWLKLIAELGAENPTIALLCKLSVARNVLLFASQTRLPIKPICIRCIDAKRWFRASVQACLFCLEAGVADSSCSYQTPIYASLTATTPDSELIIRNGRLATASASYWQHYDAIDGKSELTWRQGVKHDAAAVMELRQSETGDWQNKFGERVDVEPDYLYPLLKGSDIAKNRLQSNRAILIPQRTLGEDTHRLETTAPRLWAYLTRHQSIFQNRKSVIYKNNAPFALFGIGNYTFSDYKVGIAGLYAAPHFRALVPMAGRAVILDDTCYFVACSSAQQAAFIASLLNEPICSDFIGSIIFPDAKRPITKHVLQRIKLKALLAQVNVNRLIGRATDEYNQIMGSNFSSLVWPDTLEAMFSEPNTARLLF